MAVGLLNVLNGFQGLFGTVFSGLKKVANGNLLISLTQEAYIDRMLAGVDAYKSIDKAATEMVRSLGGGVNAIRDISRATLNAVHDLEIARKYNISSEELIRAQANYASALGRNVRLSQGKFDENGNIIEGTSQLETLAAMSRVFQDSTTEMLQNMELFGLGIDDASKRSEKMYKTAAKSGISLSKYTDTVVKNMRMAQNFTFKNGLKGLESMAKKAVELKMDMAQIEGFANKVNSLEGSVTTAAKLQVLGGPFAQFSDPLSMLSESLTDIEGLQDRMIKMFGSLGRFNKQTGEIEVSSFSKRQIREAASLMGMDYNQVMNMIQSNARREEIQKQITQTVGEGTFNKDFMELLKNTAQFRNGVAYFSDGDKEYTIEELSAGGEELQKTLMSRYQDESKDIKDIAMHLISIEESANAIVKQMETGKAYGESMKRYREGGKTSLEIFDDFRYGFADKVDFNKIGNAMGAFQHAAMSITDTLGKLILPQLEQIPTRMDGIVSGLEHILIEVGDLMKIPRDKIDGLLTGKINFSGNGSAPKPGKESEGSNFVENATDITNDVINGVINLMNRNGLETITPPLKELGGPIIGESHAKGGVPIIAEGGEFIVNQKTMENYGPLIEAMNANGAKQYHLGGYIGGGKIGNIPVSFSDSNSDILKSIDTSIKSIAPQRYTITPTVTNGIQTYKVSERENRVIENQRKPEEETPKEMTVNIKFSDLMVKGDGLLKNILPSIINSSDFVDKVRAVILSGLNGKDRNEKRFN